MLAFIFYKTHQLFIDLVLQFHFMHCKFPKARLRFYEATEHVFIFAKRIHKGEQPRYFIAPLTRHILRRC